uniref:Tankyrase 1-binding protein C-terminal domain-containing protein n=1 Tax=Mastacembelus armatus TaxID=205130 RepID=A0A7N8XIU9_9TELE
PSSESNLSPSPRKPTPPHTPDEHGSQLETETPDGLPPSSSSESPFPDVSVPTTLLDTSALRSRAQLGKKRAPRTRPSRAVRQSVAEGATGTDEEWLYRDSTEVKVENKDDDSDSEEQSRVADFSPAVASQPQRIAMFPGMDPSALMAQLKKRGDSDSQVDGSTPSPSQLSRSPKSPFLPRAARVLPTPGGKENGEENSPQWLKELKSKKRLSQYETES